MISEPGRQRWQDSWSLPGDSILIISQKASKKTNNNNTVQVQSKEIEAPNINSAPLHVHTCAYQPTDAHT